MSKRKNILMVVRWPVGGIRTYLKYVLNSFPNGLHSVLIITTDEVGAEFLIEDVKHLVTGYVVVERGDSVGKKLTYGIVRAVRKFEVDIIHAHGFTSLVCAFPASLIFRIPLVFTSHDIINESQFFGVDGFFKRNLIRCALKQCSVIQSVSRGAERNLLSFFPTMRAKSICIENGIDVGRFFYATASDVRNQIGLSPDTILVGFLGRFMNQKGFSFLVDAIKLVGENSQYKFHVVCFGSGAFIREEKQRIIKYGLADSFSFFDSVADISSVMKGLDLIVMPSLWEACPLQPMEALCAAVPFVGSDCVGLSEVLEGTPAVVVKAGSTESLSDGIIECVEKGKEPFVQFAPYAKERFDVTKCVARILDMYDKVFSHGR